MNEELEAGLYEQDWSDEEEAAYREETCEECLRDFDDCICGEICSVCGDDWQVCWCE